MILIILIFICYLIDYLLLTYYILSIYLFIYYEGGAGKAFDLISLELHSPIWQPQATHAFEHVTGGSSDGHVLLHECVHMPGFEDLA